MLYNDNSFECPDKKGVHYRRDTIEILHEKFLAEAMAECSISTFAWYLPKNVVKPKPEDWGTSLCETCLNPELKIEGLRDPEVKLETLLSLDDAQLKKWSEKFKDNNNLITYKEWQTEIVKKTKTLKGSGAKKDVNVDTKTYRSMKVVLKVTSATKLLFVIK